MFDTYTEANYKNLITSLKNITNLYIQTILNLTSSSDNLTPSVEISQKTEEFSAYNPDYRTVEIVEKKKTILEQDKTLFLTLLVQFNVLNQLSRYINDNDITPDNQLTVDNFNKSLSYLKTTIPESFKYNNEKPEIQTENNTITINFRVF